MNAGARRQVHRWLVGACLAALVPLFFRLPEVRAELFTGRRAAAVFERGSAEFMAGRYDAAATAFRQVVALVPSAAEAYGALAEAEFRAGRLDEAVVAYHRLLKIYPYTYTAETYRSLGLLELRAGREAQAARHLERAVTLDPADWLAYQYLGHAYRRLGNIAGARAAWQRVTILNPAYAPAREQLRKLDERRS